MKDMKGTSMQCLVFQARAGPQPPLGGFGLSICGAMKRVWTEVERIMT